MTIDRQAVKEWKAYPSYKDSGVEWMGKIPARWEVKRLKFVAPARISKLDTKPDNAVYVGLEHVESWTGRLLLENQPEAMDSVVSSFRSGDVLFGKLRPYLAKTARPNFDGVCTSEILALRPGAAYSQSYVMYCLLNAPLIYWLDSLTYGAKMPRLSPEQVASSFVPVPQLAEQRTIAAFLDRATQKIDALVGKKERLIDLLIEKRAALITQAVTRGLPSTGSAGSPQAGSGQATTSVPMKDSGVEWLGQIPTAWTISPVRRFLAGIEQGWSPVAEDRTATDEEWAVLKLNAVAKGKFRPEEHKALPENVSPDTRYQVRSGDFLLTRANTPELVGDVCVVRTTRPQLMLSDLVYRLRFDLLQVESSFLCYWFLSTAGRYQITRDARGSSQSMVKVSGEHIRSWVTPLPPLQEQVAIALFLDRKTAKLDALIAKIREGIEKLKEYRTALVSAAVTGKIDVRDNSAEGDRLDASSLRA